MAYFSPDLACDFARPLAPPARRLSSAERQVVTLSRRDGAASLLSRRAPSHLVRRLFGIAPPNPLADPRLEALRRYVVLLRHGGDVLASEAKAALRAHAMSDEQIRHARWLVTREPVRRPAALSPMPAGLAILLAVVSGLLAFEAVDEPVLGLVAGLMVLVTVLPLTARRARPGGSSRAHAQDRA